MKKQQNNSTHAWALQIANPDRNCNADSNCNCYANSDSNCNSDADSYGSSYCSNKSRRSHLYG
jgi:hypothetical protein